jgi:dTDP-4-amino-4,6-dideoxygalactose transaminase
MNGLKIPFTNLHQQYLDCKVEIDQAIAKTIATSSFITGPDATEFEITMSRFVGSEDCASTGSGTTALLCAMRAADIGPGDEVITTPHTFVATTEAIVSVGATPVFVDIDPDTYLIDLELVERALTKNTRAILFVDLYGQCPNIDRIRQLCNHYNLVMIEDAAQSLGNFWMDRPVGSLSDITCMSFNPVKNLGAMGDAGCVTGSRALMDRVRMYRDHGRTGRYDIVEIGYNARIDNMQSNIVMAKMPRLQEWINRKRDICNFYTDSLGSIVKTPVLEPGNSHSYYVYVIQTNQRAKLQSYLNSAGIQTNIHYARPAHIQPAFKPWYRPCPITETVCEEILSLPCWYSMTDKQVEQVVDGVHRGLA